MGNSSHHRSSVLRARVAGLGIALLLGLFQEASATHIVGGDLGYRYLGETAPGTGQFRYRLILRLYVNCGPSSNFPSVMDLVGTADVGLPVGVYLEDPNNPNVSKNLFTSADVFVTAYGVITPELPDDCNLGEGQCVEESRLEGEVILPASTSGYHLYLQIYARNEAIDDLVDPGGTGIGLYSFIPPTSIDNSSPVFVGTPVPFICIGDTTSFSNAASDIDGDSLVFSFETPYASQDQTGGIMTPPSVLDWPITEVQYDLGFDANTPFGVSGYANIDPLTGATEYAATMIGNWVVAVEVKEYRNGQFIGRIRSDLQLLSTPCSDNLAPLPENGQFLSSYQVIAGQQLCFPMSFVDANGDTIALNVNGGMFDPNMFDPPAQIVGATGGDSTFATSFCWSTVCDQGSVEPYYFSVLVADDACPPGIFSAVVSVEVIPSAAELTINGQGISCSGTVAEYCTPFIQGATYAWSVTGGTITSPTDGSCVTITWGDPGIGIISVSRSFDGCSQDALQPINILATPPAAFTVSLDTTCLGVLANLTDISQGSLASAWSLNGDPIAGNDPTVTLPFSGTATVGLTMTDLNGCVGYAEQSISVGPYDQLVHFALPNVFTPNGDNVNDRFELVTTQTLDACFSVQVFDRWGKLVYESGGGQFAWNGKRDSGEPASDGVYFYILTVQDQTFNGFVHLMR